MFTEPIPVTLLTGFLGSGKTTLLNQLIQQLPRSAIIMNEFGEIGLDHQLLKKTDGPLALLSGGCICCTVVGALSPTLKNLFMASSRGEIPQFERVIIETTGIADPAPIFDTLINERWIAARFQLNSVVTTVDAVLGDQQLDSYFEAVKQVAVADRLLLTKTDLADHHSAAALQARLAAINPAAPVITVQHGRVDPALILNAGLYDPANQTSEVKKWLNERRYRPAASITVMGRSAEAPVHDNRIRSFSVTFDKPLEWTGIYAALQMLLNLRAKSLLRMKAIVNLKGKDKPTVLHAVQHILHPPAELPEWPDDNRHSRFVFIVADLDAELVPQILREFNDAYASGLLPAPAAAR
ncbi:ATP-binding protein [Sulfuriferula plumbiphila]|uniref:ATP-binding protein n=1 Tax=Sulfuriferula plumbiphila TaxID=171865 RepID=A0A512L327_9PROT|nr:GTP-binding protein [Sulfuriferula plumbiphila]BBP02586.1 ATP-binding protein [Sulfuriferula plumbiphila]GEP28880.1 ATP-binding protein [Sulfuriferula plumbiphila]